MTTRHLAEALCACYEYLVHRRSEGAVQLYRAVNELFTYCGRPR